MSRMSVIGRDRHFSDTLILGSGPAAFATAIGSAEAGASVTVLKRVVSGAKVTFGEHLAPKAKVYLHQLGLAGVLGVAPQRPSHGITSVWGAAQPHTRDYISNPYGCGWNLDRAAFDRAGLDAARTKGADVFEISRLDAVDRTDNGEGWVLAVTTPIGRRSLTGRFLIDASGRAAVLARRLDLRPVRHDKLVGLYGRITGQANEEANLLVEAVSEGWWYSAPLADGSLVAVFMTDVDLIPAGSKARADFWRSQLRASEATRARIADPPSNPMLHVAPAGSQSLSIHGGPNWLAVGDASMAFDPLAAVGITKALQDGLKAADYAKMALDEGTWSPDAYTGTQNTAFRNYLHQRMNYYRMEQRWPRSLFWQRRHGPA